MTGRQGESSAGADARAVEHSRSGQEPGQHKPDEYVGGQGVHFAVSVGEAFVSTGGAGLTAGLAPSPLMRGLVKSQGSTSLKEWESG